MPECPVCGEPIRASNLRRHLGKRHPNVRTQTIPERTEAFRKLLERKASDQEIAEFLGLKLADESKGTARPATRAERVIQAIMDGGSVDIVDVKEAMTEIRSISVVVPAAVDIVQKHDAFLEACDSADPSVDCTLVYDEFVASLDSLRHLVMPSDSTVTEVAGRLPRDG